MTGTVRRHLVVRLPIPVGRFCAVLDRAADRATARGVTLRMTDLRQTEHDGRRILRITHPAPATRSET
ncbi:hypothetical protein [Embleya sp. NPDC059237]|uniref:hypothetical protein n=1 Tax=Embleya sp. NPDC059237 TaxID=3346784 RepID=UPI00367872E9